MKKIITLLGIIGALCFLTKSLMAQTAVIERDGSYALVEYGSQEALVLSSIDLTNFEAWKQPNGNFTVRFDTDNEQNVYRINVEQYYNGEFRAIKSYPPHGTGKPEFYLSEGIEKRSFTDFFRVAVLFHDGKEYHSKIISIQ